MPIACRVDHALRLVIARAYGTFAEGDIHAYQADVWSQPEVQGYHEIVDMSLVTEIVTPTLDKVHWLARISAKMDDPDRRSKFAIIAPSDVAFGMGRMYASMRGTQTESTKEVGVFRTLDEALEFLEIPGPIPLPDID